MDRKRSTSIVTAVALALATPAFAQTRGGAFPAGERYQEPSTFAPAQHSRYHVQAVDLDGGSARVRVPASGSTRLLVWTISLTGQKLRTNFETPDGRVLFADEAQSALRDLGRAGFASPDLGLAVADRAAHEVVYVEKPAAGGHELALEGRGAALVVAAEPDSSLTLSTAAGPLSRQPGEPLVLRAELRDADAAVPGASVTARIAGPDGRAGAAVTLRDDGQSSDGAAGDGVYGAVVNEAPNGAGTLNVRFDAEGSDARGSAFARTGGSSVVNEPATARLESVTARVVEGGLLVTADAVVKDGGRFRFDVTVAGAADADGIRPALAWAEDSRRLDAGRRALRVLIPIGRLPGLGVDPLFVDATLLGYDPLGVAGRVTVDVR